MLQKDSRKVSRNICFGGSFMGDKTVFQDLCSSGRNIPLVESGGGWVGEGVWPKN